MSSLDQKEFQRRLGQIEELIEGIDKILDPTVQASTRELVQLVLDLHGAGIERMLELVLELVYESGPDGQALIDGLARDELVGSLLLLHELHPYDLETRVLRALETVRPYMRSHGGNVDFLGVDEKGVVRLRLEGSCHECASSRVTLKYAVENAIYAVAPDVTAIEAEGVVEKAAPLAAGFIPLSDIRISSSYSGPEEASWVTVEELPALAGNAPHMRQVSGVPVLFVRIDGTCYAYGNTCPHCGSSLAQAVLEGRELACPTCGHRYDLVQAGRDRTNPGLHLAPLPLLEEGGRVRIALPALTSTAYGGATPPGATPPGATPRGAALAGLALPASQQSVDVQL